jgi:hypothetical protein
MHDRRHWLEILQHNQGFADPDEWLAYAEAHGFQKVAARTLVACPSGGRNASRNTSTTAR